VTTATVDQAARAVVTRTFPYDKWHDLYQEYYQTGLKLYLQSQGLDLHLVSHTHFPAFLKVLRQVRHAPALRRVLGSHSGTLEEYLDWVARRIGGQHTPSAPHVGEYVLGPDALRSAKVCIDSHDSGTIYSPSLMEGCDVYLKTQYWQEQDYDQRVRPFFNCNPKVLPTSRSLKE
jgi:hypothetical protein